MFSLQFRPSLFNDLWKYVLCCLVCSYFQSMHPYIATVLKMFSIIVLSIHNIKFFCVFHLIGVIWITLYFQFFHSFIHSFHQQNSLRTYHVLLYYSRRSIPGDKWVCKQMPPMWGVHLRKWYQLTSISWPHSTKYVSIK